MLTFITGLAVLAAVQAPDTTIAVARGQRLQVSLHAGTVQVRGWNRDAVRVQISGDDRAELDVRNRGDRLAIDATGRRGEPVDAMLQISAPAWMPVSVDGVGLDIDIGGITAALSAETVQGDVVVQGGGDIVTLGSVEGTVQVRGARGKLQVSSVNDDVEVTDAIGDLAVTTVNGDVQLSNVRSENVDASTVNGDIGFSGPIRNGGRYRFATHNGDLTVAVPENTSAVVSIATYQGDLETAFPVSVSGRRRGQRFSFTLGGGGARIELESFMGDIRLVRPGATGTR